MNISNPTLLNLASNLAKASGGNGNITEPISLGNFSKLALQAANANKLKTAGLVGLGLGNIGGLTDNDKFGGQLGGAALGGLGAYALGSNPYTAAMLTLGGGELGALFDKLRAKKEQTQIPVPNSYGGR